MPSEGPAKPVDGTQEVSERIGRALTAGLMVVGGWWAWHHFTGGPNLTSTCAYWATFKADLAAAPAMGSLEVPVAGQTLAAWQQLKIAANASGDTIVAAAADTVPMNSTALNNACA